MQKPKETQVDLIRLHLYLARDIQMYRKMPVLAAKPKIDEGVSYRIFLQMYLSGMFDVFKNYLQQKTQISEEEIKAVQKGSILKKLRKGESLLHEGEIWATNCFIASGSLRLYRTDDDGIDHTFRFGIENWWMTDQESYNLQTPSLYNIEALSASTVIIWKKEKWEHLLETIPVMRKFNEQLLARAYEASQRRIYSLISLSATEKYFEFQKIYPGIFHRVPLHMLASYLGVSKETLSRIRKEYVKS